MTRRNIVILEDNDERIRDFTGAVASLGDGFELRLWVDACRMQEECSSALSNCCLISLDHDLTPMPGVTTDPGTGLEIAQFLATQPPICPVIVHTANYERRWSMNNELRFAKWKVEIVYPISDGWIYRSWLPRVMALIGI